MGGYLVLTVVFALAAIGAGGCTQKPADDARLSSGAEAQELGAGDQAPGFALPGSDGKTHRLADYSGKTVVLAWFPKAFTGG